MGPTPQRLKPTTLATSLIPFPSIIPMISPSRPEYFTNTHQDHSCPRAFALAAPSPGDHVAHLLSGLCRNVTSAKRISLSTSSDTMQQGLIRSGALGQQHPSPPILSLRFSLHSLITIADILVISVFIIWLLTLKYKLRGHKDIMGGVRCSVPSSRSCTQHLVVA